MNQRFGEVAMPEIVVEDVAELRRKRLMPTPFSPRLRDEIEAALQQGQQAIVFLNRRGFSPVLQCRSCGWSPHCTRCDVPLTLHLKMNKMVCHYCGTHYDVPTHCPQCEQADLRDMGAGTEKIEAAIETCFPQAKVGRMDLDTTRSRSAYERIIRDFQHGQTNLLVGTQMVTKGLDFGGVSVVGIINADQLLNQCDFRAQRTCFSNAITVAGRAGRRGKQGRVVSPNTTSETSGGTTDCGWRLWCDVSTRDAQPPTIPFSSCRAPHRHLSETSRRTCGGRRSPPDGCMVATSIWGRSSRPTDHMWDMCNCSTSAKYS